MSHKEILAETPDSTRIVPRTSHTMPGAFFDMQGYFILFIYLVPESKFPPTGWKSAKLTKRERCGTCDLSDYMNHFCDVCDRELHERCNIYFRGPKSFRCRRCNEKPQPKEMPLWAKLAAMPPITYHVSNSTNG